MVRYLNFFLITFLYWGSQSCAMSGDWHDNNRLFDPLGWLFRQMPFARRNTRQQRTAQFPAQLQSLESHEEVISQASPSNESIQDACEAGESPIETLSADPFNNILSHLCKTDKEKMSFLSKRCKQLAHCNQRHITIPSEDITEKNLEDVEYRFPSVKSLTIIGKSISPNQLELVLQKFPLIEYLDLGCIEESLTREQFAVISKSGIAPIKFRFNLCGNKILLDVSGARDSYRKSCS